MDVAGDNAVFSPKTTFAAGYVKPFTWSYSKLKNFRNCPKKHYHVDLAPKGTPERFEEGRSQALEDGEFIHTAMEKRCRDGIALPPAIADYEIEARKALDVTPPGSLVFVEEKAAIREDFSACGYFDKKVWLRMKIDFGKIVGNMASIRDWKTGKIVEDSEQLALNAQWVFSAYPQVEVVVTRYVWLGQQADTRQDFERKDIVTLWNALWPELEAYKLAVNNMDFPPKPGGLCRNYCPVTSCPYHGKGYPR